MIKFKYNDVKAVKIFYMRQYNDTTTTNEYLSISNCVRKIE